MPADDGDWEPLVRLVREGDVSAERELVERLYPRVAGRIAALRPRRETMEDLVQEVMIKVFQRLDQYRGGVFPAWVDVIAKRVCYDALRKQRVRPEWTFAELGERAPEEGGTTELEPTYLDAVEVLGKLFTMMPPAQAWLLQEVELKERPIGKVAVEMGWAAAPARLRLFRARKKLKRIFEQWKESEHAS
ncbi:RNA polymerase sigma factor [Haloferula sp.]|uniref:RNA polymerase sigma factor n=1 Tax=Haloferula sp. TaxID=2497595 RepID=UPI00329E41EA